MASVEQVIRQGGNATIIPTATDLMSPGVLESVTGPFFLGFAFEFMGMGVLLMLGIHYFVTLSHNKSSTRVPASLDYQTRLGPILVSLSIFFNLVQTILDMVRGWNMFASGFMDIKAFATPDYMWFASPFFGLFPAMITQIFLLRRITLFLSSLSSLWPALDRKSTRMAFVIIMAAGILVSFVSGCIGTYWIWKGGPLWEFFTRRNRVSYISDMVWLSTSSAVDVVLSIVLSLELWWARRKLAAKGGLMAKVTWQLLLVTFHGGLAVTGLQLTALFLFEYRRAAAFCYLPILFLPKIYTLTLILSLTLPQNHQAGHTASHVFSLPNLESNPNHQHSGSGNAHANGITPPYSTGLYHRHASPTPVLPPLQLSTSAKEKEKDKRKSTKSNLSGAVAKSWRLSQDWLSWSLVSTEDRRETNKEADKEEAPPARWKLPDHDEQLTPPTPGFDTARRPSEPNSLAPLLPSGPRSSLSVNSYPTTSTYSQADQIQSQSQYLPHHYPYYQQQHPYSPRAGPHTPVSQASGQVPWSSPAVTSPSRSIAVSRSHSFSTGGSIPQTSSLSPPPPPNNLGQVPGSPHTNIASTSSPHLGSNNGQEGFRFDTANPFGTYPRHKSTLTPIRSVSDEEHAHPHTGPREREHSTDKSEGGLSPTPGTRARLMSFEDMLSGPPLEAAPGGRKGSGGRRIL